MPRGPIFIGGPDRCGKTLLAAILGSHSRIAIPIVGSNLWTFFYRQYGDLERDRNLDRCLSALARYKHAVFLRPDLDRVRAEMPPGQRSYERLFALIHEQFAERAGKPRWGDQTGLIERYADRVFAAYDGAVMLHMIRDPRDRYEASLRLWPKGRARAGGAAARWRTSAQLAERNRRRHPGRYRIVRYEDLVRDPDGTIRGLLDLLEERYEPEMLTMRDAPTYRRKLGGGDEPDPGAVLISDTHVGDFRGRVPDHEIRFLQDVLGRPMRRLDYRPDDLPLGPVGHLRYIAWSYPVNLLRMGAWTALDVLQLRLPGIVRRHPAGAKVVAKGG